MNSYDLFISYSRRDNAAGRVTQLVDDYISRDFQTFAGWELRPFFDQHEIRGMDDWQDRILQGLRESCLFLAFPFPGLPAQRVLPVGGQRVPQARRRKRKKGT